MFRAYLLILLLHLLRGGQTRRAGDDDGTTEHRKKKEKERHDALVKDEAQLIIDARAPLAANSSGASLNSSNTSNSNSTNSELREAYDFIFGWSTGHVGTTTLSEKRMYWNPDNVTFLHEMKYGRMGLPGASDIYTTDTWLVGNYSLEYQYVKHHYIPWLLRNKYPRSLTVMDLGHNINYFVNALIDYLLDETKYKFAFVRLRRERLEAAQSLTFGHPDKAFSDVCADLLTRFCPFDHVTSNMLQIPGPNAYGLWANFSNIQKALWIGDETEMRWQDIKRRYAGRFKYIEVLWAKQWEGSIDFAALQVAQLFGVRRIQSWNPSWPHMEQHVHAGDAAVDPVALLQAYREDKAYQELMGYRYIPA